MLMLKYKICFLILLKKIFVCRIFQDSSGNTPLAWAKEMNAMDVINELERRGGVADKEWHGEKLEMKTNEQRAEEAWGEGDFDPEAGHQQEQKATTGIENSRFEIEIEDSKSKKANSSNAKDTNILDALQRQRPTAKTVF